jgi:hypothetical protein
MDVIEIIGFKKIKSNSKEVYLIVFILCYNGKIWKKQFHIIKTLSDQNTIHSWNIFCYDFKLFVNKYACLMLITWKVEASRAQNVEDSFLSWMALEKIAIS